MRNIVALICALIMDTGTWLSRSHANGHKNVSRRVNCYNEECAARECAANFSTVGRRHTVVMPRAELLIMPRAELLRHTVIVLSVRPSVCLSVFYKHFSSLAKN